jgi:hypothetical protein
MKQIYHPYQKWEDYKAGMWRKETKENETKLLQVAIDFTGNHILYGEAMIEVIKTWKYACEHNLSNVSINRKAWVGHAACCKAKKLPEYIVRDAWGKLTEEQRILANMMAERAIKMWESEQLSKKQSIQMSLW